MGYIKPDSALARAATDLLSRHAGRAGGTCASCDETSPCASARHAIEVRRAAGLPDTISATDALATQNPDPLSAPSFGGGGFSANSGFADPPTPALAAGSSLNSGSFGTRVGLSKVSADAD